MELIEINALYDLNFRNTIKELSESRSKIEEVNQHKNQHAVFNAISSYLNRYEILLTAYNYNQESSSYNTHEIKKAIISRYKNSEGDYKDNALFYFLKEHLLDIKNTFSNRIESIKQQTGDSFDLIENDVIALLAREEAYRYYIIEFKKEWDDFFAQEFEKSKGNQEEQYDLHGIEQIEWYGTQKELAELFIELKKKGYIKEIKSSQIKSFFTKADTIQQILKPATDPKTKNDTYSGVYTSNYKSRFDSIKPTTNTPEKK